jgi:hypothetical protein
MLFCMETRILLNIEYKPSLKCQGGTSWVTFGEMKLYERALSFGAVEKWHILTDGKISKAIAYFEASFDDSRTHLILKLIHEAFGLSISPHTRIKTYERSQYFGPDLNRIYTKKDVEAAPLLRWAGAKADIGTYLRQTDREQWFLSPDKRLKNKFDAGFLSPFPALAVSAGLKEALEHSNLKGLDFNQVKLEPPSPSPKEIWRIDSQLRMPPCLLPIQHQDGSLFSGDFAKGSLWDDAGIMPYELKFSSAEVAAMGAFDVALTMERTGMDASHAFRDIIVSQKFRQVLERLRAEKILKIPPLEFVPVRLAE